MTSQTCSGSWVPWAIKNLNPIEAYTINYIDFNMLGDMIHDRHRKEEPYESHFRNRPISRGRSLSRFWPERLPELYSPAAAGRHRGTVHGSSVCLTLSV